VIVDLHHWAIVCREQAIFDEMMISALY